MISIRGKYENGKIQLAGHGNEIPESAEVILTFLIESKNEQVEKIKNVAEPSGRDQRQFERVKAQGNISIIDRLDRYLFPLFDYSQGGLSFVAGIKFENPLQISAGISDPSNPDIILMELEMEVRGAFEVDNGYKIGCMFIDPMDEELWHGILPYLA